MRKALITAASILAILFQSLVYADTNQVISKSEQLDEVSIGKTVPNVVDNSNVLVEVTLTTSSGESSVIYTGALGGYVGGMLNDIDFSEVDAAIIFDWDSSDMICIKPLNRTTTENDKFVEDSLEEKEVLIYQNSVMQASTLNADINLSLLYSNAYNEAVLMSGEELTAELKVKNNNDESQIRLSTIIALYDSDGKMVDVNIDSFLLEANGEDTFNSKIVVPIESSISEAKIMVWESIDNMKPYFTPIILTLSGNDFFGDDYNLSHPINDKNKANGKINNFNDTDVFSFVPKNDGLYYFETLSNIDTYASLYANDNLTTPVATDDNSGADYNFRLSATLEAGTNYYLYLNGRDEGQYTLNYGYSIGNVFGTVYPVKFYDNDTEYNSEIEATVGLNTYYTGEFVATMHLKDWSDNNNEYASYSMTGVHAGDYLVKIKRPGYLTCYQKISLNDNAIDLGSITLIPGDVNGDDVIDSVDLNLVNSLVGTEHGSESYVISADINSDKVINAEDVSLVNANLNKNSNEYASNVNVLFIDVETYDTQLIVTGSADPNSVVNCVVFYEGYSIYEGETACSSDGLIEFIVDLSKSGNYTVLVTSDNQAYEVTKTITY